NLAVSGEHAVVHLSPFSGEVEVEDIGSTNGTYVNGKTIRRQFLRSGDTIEIGRYKICILNEAEGESAEKTMVFKPGMAPPPTAPRPGAASLPPGPLLSPAPAPSLASLPPPVASIRVLSGTAAGREVLLTKVVTTIGKPGVAIASITRRHQGFVLAHVEGPQMPTLNGAPIGANPVPLHSGDHLELAGTAMQFVQG
ncbi:MAG: FHA domain-containing protein, partial [Simplicispira sp.]|nr:FHA domain-containing protein [Simplicispira sp.]